MTLAEIITTGMNNPECAFFVGSFFGSAFIIKIALIVSAIGFLYKAADNFIVEPLFTYIKRKWRERKK